MKFSYVVALVTACSSVVANPVEDILYRRDAVANGTAPAGGASNGTGAAGGASNGTGPAGTASNGTTSAPSSSNTSWNSSTGSTGSAGSVSVIVTGGSSSLSNSTGVDVSVLFNSSQALNVTQLYQVATMVNQSLGQGSNGGVVIVSNSESLESLGFFCSLVFNTDKPIVITENGAAGSAIVQQSSAWARGPLVLGANKQLYPGVFAPPSGETSSCAAVGIASDTQNVTWFFENSMPVLVGPTSVIKQNYSNFTNTQFSSLPVIPIIYDGSYSNQIISSLTTASGFVVVSSGSNSTTSSVGTVGAPVVFAEEASQFVGQQDVPAGTIPAGYLSPLKAQILLSVAAANGVNSTEALRSLFP